MPIQMKIFSWVQRKLRGNQEAKKPTVNCHLAQEPCKEEFSDWPHGLLGIGTFGTNNLKDGPDRCNDKGNQSSSQDHSEDTILEEVGELQKELDRLFLREFPVDLSSAEESGTRKLSLDYFNQLSGVEADRMQSGTANSDPADQTGQLQRATTAALSRGKDTCLAESKKALSRKSFSLLLKEIFLNQKGFAPAPSLIDPIPDKSRMEKILRAIMQKKRYPRSSTPKPNAKKYLGSNHTASPESDDEMLESEKYGSKWVKTDSEYIVLEI